ncbi:MAG: hypothetical protein JWP03_1805 [Phycisphaerales bacterium]|nr:hypothetical protein [Phycisphaerales bacterium]
MCQHGSADNKRYPVRKLLHITLGALIFLTAHGSPTLADLAPDDDQGTQQPYFDRLMGGAFFQQHIDVVLARVVGPLATWPDGYDTGYTLEILDDYGGGLKEHERVKMFGTRPVPNGSSFGPLRTLAADDVMLLAIAPLKAAGQFRYRELTTPMGLGCPSVVKPGWVAAVRRTLADLRRLVPKDGKGELPRADAYRLLASEEPLRWALGASLVAYDPAPGDVESLKRIVNTQEDLTLPQAVWVYYLLTSVVPEDKRPSKADSDALLVGYVGRVAKPLGE